MTFLSPEKQQARFGMSQAEAQQLKERVQARLDPGDVALARQVWTGMTAEVKAAEAAGGPHPEAVRFKMLKGLDRGYRPGEAAEYALRFARGEEP